MVAIKKAVGSMAGIGALPAAPGTWGSLASLGLLYPAALFGGTVGILLCVLAGSLLTLWSAGACEQAWGEDPPRMVIDEFAGQGIPLLFLPLTGNVNEDLLWLAAAFLLFRLFDIFKPMGIKRLQHLRSGFGILLDDLLAGCYALACLQFGIWFTAVLLV